MTFADFVKQQYIPHKGQQAFHESGARFRLLVTGRRFGKTLAGADETGAVLRDSSPNSRPDISHHRENITGRNPGLDRCGVLVSAILDYDG